MHEENTAPKPKWRGWLIPNSRALNAWPRITLAFVINVVLTVYLLANVHRIGNTQNIYYERIDWVWTWIAAAGSLTAVTALAPALAFARSIQRWLAIILLPLPLFVAVAEWFQLLGEAFAHGFG